MYWARAYCYLIHECSVWLHSSWIMQVLGLSDSIQLSSWKMFPCIVPVRNVPIYCPTPCEHFLLKDSWSMAHYFFIKKQQQQLEIHYQCFGSKSQYLPMFIQSFLLERSFGVSVDPLFKSCTSKRLVASCPQPCSASKLTTLSTLSWKGTDQTASCLWMILLCVGGGWGWGHVIEQSVKDYAVMC